MAADTRKQRWHSCCRIVPFSGVNEHDELYLSVFGMPVTEDNKEYWVSLASGVKKDVDKGFNYLLNVRLRELRTVIQMPIPMSTVNKSNRLYSGAPVIPPCPPKAVMDKAASKPKSTRPPHPSKASMDKTASKPKTTRPPLHQPAGSQSVDSLLEGLKNVLISPSERQYATRARSQTKKFIPASK